MVITCLFGASHLSSKEDKKNNGLLISKQIKIIFGEQ